jgi:zinc protease
VSGLPFHPVADVLSDWRSMTPERVSAALRAARDSAVLYVPEGSRFPGIYGLQRRFMCNRQGELPRGTTFRTPALTRLVNKSARMSIAVTDVGLAERDADGDGHLIPWQEVEAVVPADDGRGYHVVGRNMCGIVVHEELYGRKAVTALRERIPAHLWLAPPPESRRVPAPRGPVD